jgi:hypothetical protein
MGLLKDTTDGEALQAKTAIVTSAITVVYHQTERPIKGV